MKKVAIYCRLSDEDRNKVNKLDDSESIQNQKNLLMKYAFEQEWDIYKIYSDDDYSGLDKERPEFNQMIEDAEGGKFEIILCKHQSRFSRDIEVIEKYLHNKFIEWGIRFVSLTDHVDTLDKGNKKSRQINSLVNEWYCEDISEAIRATFKIKREQGKYIGSFATYGYMKDPEDKNSLVVDEEAARVVKMIFDWYLNGYGTQHIAYMLNDRGIPNPTKYKRSKGLKYINSAQVDGYGLWNKTTIRRILRNEIYIGNMVQGKKEKVNYKSKKVIAKDQDDWIVVRDTHEAIIDRSVFNKVQSRIDNNVRSTGKGRVHIFATKVRCMDCGNTMTKVRSSQGHEYLRCKLYARSPKKKLCTIHSIRLDQLKEEVFERVKKHIQLVDEGRLGTILKQEIEINEIKNNLNTEMKKVEEKICQKELIIKNLYIDKVNGLIAASQFNQLNDGFLKEKSNLEKMKVNLQEEIKTLSGKSQAIDHWVAVVKKYKDIKGLTHEVVNELIDYIEIGEKDKKIGEQKIKVHWNF
ncbi:recombinase family protein [Alkaliphilus hydrothermalis]|uniref:DNA invertase Pin-like site-specific DNA recombinase/ssDNA-binding Zn-finger/Zn-ribbon topoisomerase 1 n=1 Tax=Alkaliphilus hydrothermalis TaxID=1482730 RepID=A0ABS2NSC8_9FIRM|nr:recombinase family protein [Alkaliphilus hydrothermalis]MBM7615741.1 DNA invertase Pin-like site-specific DNA recombinase/ssDNA-binding Zn-finger/Zn-ribbon topoisomerase 1 [Alkaliphilus hydrothermalis]